MLLQINSNSKLGNCGAVSLPAKSTCPGKTTYCDKVCYAAKGFSRFSRVKDSLERNYEISLTDEFVPLLIKEINKKKLKVVRIHPSGDFYNANYIEKWIEIVKACPDTSFWVYTRSWSIPSMQAPLQALALESNIQVWASVDDTTVGTPTGLRVAAVAPSWDSYDNSYVRCPAQKNPDITCTKCTYCFKPSTSKKQNIVFKEH